MSIYIQLHITFALPERLGWSHLAVLAVSDICTSDTLLHTAGVLCIDLVQCWFKLFVVLLDHDQAFKLCWVEDCTTFGQCQTTC